MPIYEFVCVKCEDIVEELRKVGDFTEKPCAHCGTKRFKVVSVPSMHVWEAGRWFPNLRSEGDGAMNFPTRHAYEEHLKDNHVAESSLGVREV